MRRYIFGFIALFIVSVIVWSVTKYSYQKQIDLLKVEINNYQKQLVEKKDPILTLADTSFIINKNKELTLVKNSLLYFDFKTEKITANRWKIIITLNGETGSAADAADLKLDLPENLTVSDIEAGTAFPILPRQINENNSLLLSGLASIDNNQVILGKPNKIFAEFTVQTANNRLNNEQIKVNKEDTKIYLNGENVLDSSKSANLIDLP